MSPLKLYALLLDYRFLVNFGIANFVLLTVLLIPKFIRWVLFGDALDQREIASIREKFNYTLFEFIWGLVILKNIDRESLTAKTVFKYALLFACLVITKSFHYLCDMRVATQARDINNGQYQTKSSLKLFIGINTLICVDALVFLKIKDDMQNSMNIIFGFEVLNLCPLILITMVNYTSSVYMHYRNMSQSPTSLPFVILDFTLNLVRMSLFITYTWICYQNFTFPAHMIPSSYRCFRMLLTKTRNLIIHARNQKMFKRYLTLPKTHSIDGCSNDTCFCLEELSQDKDNDIRKLACNHAFHYECLKWWLVKSETCPVCRTPLQFTISLNDTQDQAGIPLVIT